MRCASVAWTRSGANVSLRSASWSSRDCSCKACCRSLQRSTPRASHSNVRAALASDTVFGGTVDRLEAFYGAMHDVGGREALRVVLEERAGASVAVVGAVATVLCGVTCEAAEVARRVAADGASGFVVSWIRMWTCVVAGRRGAVGQDGLPAPTRKRARHARVQAKGVRKQAREPEVQ